MLDDFREKPRETLTGILDRRKKVEPDFRTPRVVGALSWLFLHPGRRAAMGRIMTRVLGLESWDRTCFAGSLQKGRTLAGIDPQH
jgi:hypothetical protein